MIKLYIIITDMKINATVPAILPVVDEPYAYVAIEDAVVLYIDFK